MTRRIRRHLAQSGDRVEVTEGPYAGRRGLVTAIHLIRDEGAHRREAAVLLDSTGEAGVWSWRFADHLLRVLDHPTRPITEERGGTP